MSRRDSDSKRRHSRFDREPSPKRYRKQERDRATTSATEENGDQRHHPKLRDSLPHEAPLAADHSKQQSGDLLKDTNKKPIDHHEAPKHAPDPTQHDERGSAGQAGRSSGQRKAGERGWWKDSKNQHNERAKTSHGREMRDEKSQAKPNDDTFQRRDGFSGRKDDSLPATRKRPAFREKKIPVDLGDADPAVKSGQIDHPPERNERREERSSNPRQLDRPEKQFADDRAPNKGEARRDGFPLRGRYGGNGDDGNYRGRDKFNGRQGYRPIKTQTEKWKHDLYQEVNKDHIPQKNEDDQIAKLEALLAS
ncbi:uncharacterized protein LOC133299074 isoform X2 [Gastrolobium bilobum]|uniref:uncharacterized protein LOC133299074 isoform X2 n=1 Tax=Gastrolobium bilobum TaxID=150636 RepID=UPI002AAF6B86|nr:uncharacterized protein LOC133299074 isoform X2 [Gastrolobium bilobum]